MRRMAVALGMFALTVVATSPAQATIRYDKGSLALSPMLGTSLKLKNTETVFKVGSDLDYFFSQSLAFNGGLYFGFSGDVFDLEIAPGIRYRFLGFYKDNIDFGLRGALYFQFLRGAGANLLGFGAKFGPTFRYFVTDKLGLGMDLSIRLGAIDTLSDPVLGRGGGFSFSASLDLLFGITLLL